MENFAREFLEKYKNEENPCFLLEKAQNAAIECGHHFYSGTDAKESVASLKGELSELEEALNEGFPKEEIRNELGDVLLNLINLTRLCDLSFEEVSKNAAGKWLSRKALQEQKILEAGYTWRTVPDEVSHQIWKEVKSELKAQEAL